MKKIFKIVLLISALILISGVASAAAIPNSLPATNKPAQKSAPVAVKYTAEQQACLKTAQAKRSASIKAAADALNAATKDALAIRQAAIKAATDIFSAATKDALATRQAAITAAQKITDAKARMDAVKAAANAYNNDSAVKQAKVPYVAAVKAANDAYNSSAAVKQAKDPYTTAVKAANSQFQADQKACLGSSSSPQ